MKIQITLLVLLIASKINSKVKHFKKASKHSSRLRQENSQIQKTMTIFDQNGNTKEQKITEYNPNKKYCGFKQSPQEIFCNSLTDCAICSKTLNCGWCSKSQKCLSGAASQPFCPGDCLIGWIFDNSQCSNLTVFGSLLTRDPEARSLQSPELTGPKVKINLHMRNGLKRTVEVLAGQQSVIDHVNRNGDVKHREQQSPIRYQLSTMVPTDGLTQSQIFDQATGQRLDVQMFEDKEYHGADEDTQ